MNLTLVGCCAPPSWLVSSVAVRCVCDMQTLQGRVHLEIGPNTLVYSNILCGITNNQLLPQEPGFVHTFSCLGYAVRLWEGCRSHFAEFSDLRGFSRHVVWVGGWVAAYDS